VEPVQTAMYWQEPDDDDYARWWTSPIAAESQQYVTPRHPG
jgi:hypothetical protein